MATWVINGIGDNLTDLLSNFFNPTHMNTYKSHIGIDVSKNTLDITLFQNKENVLHIRVSNDEKGLDRLKRKLKKHKVIAKESLVCLENSGLYGYRVSCWAVQNGFSVWIENALAIKRSMGLVRGKNDKVDSERIALYAMRFEDKCQPWEPPRKAVRHLQHLLTTRSRLITSLKSLKTPLAESALVFGGDEQQLIDKCSSSAIKGLEQALKDVEREMDVLIREDDRLSRLVEVITSIDGVGRCTATAIIGATNEMKSAKSKGSLASYAGIAPFEHSSGTSIRGRTRVSHLANKDLKSYLHMCALAAIRYSDEMREYYNRKVAEGKPKMLVINAVRNKLTTRISICVAEDRLYEKNFSRRVAAA